MSADLQRALQEAQTRIQELEQELETRFAEEKESNPQAWKAALLRLFTTRSKPITYADSIGLIKMLNEAGYGVTGKDQEGNVDRLLNELNNLDLVRKFGTGLYGSKGIILTQEAKGVVAKLVQQNNSRKQANAKRQGDLLESNNIGKDAKDLQKAKDTLEKEVSYVMNESLTADLPLLEEDIQAAVSKRLGKKVHFQAVSLAAKAVYIREGKWRGVRTPKGDYAYTSKSFAPEQQGFSDWSPSDNFNTQTPQLS